MKKKHNNTTTARARITKATEENSSFLSKLEQLRNFVSDSISENDVSTCLRQCSYNVNVAAEQLMTGQYIIKKNQTFFLHSPRNDPIPHHHHHHHQYEIRILLILKRNVPPQQLQ